MEEPKPPLNELYKRQLAEEIRLSYEAYSRSYDKWIQRNAYYYKTLARVLRSLVPSPKRVLEIGCGQGYFLAALKPEVGVGIDFSSAHIESARKAHPEYRFDCLDVCDAGGLGERFDTVIAVNVFSELTDVTRALQELRKVMHPGSRLVVLDYSVLWEPILRAGATIGLRPHRRSYHWMAEGDFLNVFELGGFGLVSSGRRMLLPKYVPLLSGLLNRLLDRLPVLNRLGFCQFYVTRPLLPRRLPRETTVSVVVPCKNEEGNIEDVLMRTPVMGAGTEIIVVNDRSTDRTEEFALRQVERFPEKHIRVVQGPGEGKGAACREGFRHARNDVLMILDADMSVMPEDMKDFFDAIASGKGEFINGNRLLYVMEAGAMRIANVFGNKMFAVLFSFIIRQRIKDTLCGTKAMFREDYWKTQEAREFFGDIDVWGDYDWIFGAARHNLRILELPVHYRARKEGTTKMTQRLRNAAVMLRMCWAAFRKLYLR